ncbi:MAG: CRTAC1 family protein [Planctomycetaceae bacterium]|nr:CRTAC1 family protein [Planctomycetaceae bacterium]
MTLFGFSPPFGFFSPFGSLTRVAPALICLVGMGSLGCSQGPQTEIPAFRETAGAATKAQNIRSISDPEREVLTPLFENVAAEKGIDATFDSDTVPDRYFLPEIMGGGAAWLDYDRDGWLDVYLANGTAFEPGQEPLPRANWLYRSRGGETFELLSETIGAADSGYGQGVAPGDFDADGFPDLYIGNFQENHLHVNNGDGTFSLCPPEVGVNDTHWTSSVVWVDLNHDDLLDLYVTNYLRMTLDDRKVCEYQGNPGYCGPGQYEAAPDSVFISRGDGTFVEASAELGLQDTTGKGLAVVIADFNDDRNPEIYVGNDMTSNFLYRRVERPTEEYEEVAELSGVAQSGEGMNEATMGIACSDFNLDGLPDLYLTHYFNMQNTLYLNHGDLQFEDASRRAGTAHTAFPYLGFGTIPIDYNRDGFDDLFVTNGHVLGPKVLPDRMRPQLLRNVNGRKFEEESTRLGEYFSKAWLGRSTASGDFDNDGDLDILVTHLDEPAALLQNHSRGEGTFIGIQLETPSRIPPIGAKVTIRTETETRSRSFQSGGSYLASHDSRLLFSVDEGQSSIDVVVDWPDGSRQEFLALPTGRYWQILQGSTPW